MKTRFLVLGGVFLLASTLLSAQELKVESFKRLDRDLLARTAQRLDLNDEPCAVVRVSVAKAKSFFFLGNVIGDVAYRPGEAMVYMTSGTRKIVVNSDKFGTLEYEFPERLEESVTYRLELKLVENKDKRTRTLLMPILGDSEIPAYGAMIGIVKKVGFYFKYKSNFKSLHADWVSRTDGSVIRTYDSVNRSASENYYRGGDQVWYSGDKKNTRYSITGGYMHRLSKRFYMYIGGGYGEARVGWSTVDEDLATGKEYWAEIDDYSHKGAEGEIGFILRQKSIAFSVGYQTNQFKFHEVNWGIGLLF